MISQADLLKQLVPSKALQLRFEELRQDRVQKTLLFADIQTIDISLIVSTEAKQFEEEFREGTDAGQ